MLLVGKSIPLHDRASGDYRLLQILDLLSKDFEVDFLSLYHPVITKKDGRLELIPRDSTFAEDRCIFLEAPYQERLKTMGINVLNQVMPISPTIRPTSDYQIDDYLKAKKYDCIWVEFYYLMNKYLEVFHRYQPWAHLIVDTVDVHYRRLETQLEYTKTQVKYFVNTRQERRKPGRKLKEMISLLEGHVEAVMKQELKIYEICDTVVAVSESDRLELCKHLPESKILYVPNIHRPRETLAKFAPRSSRHGSVFVGNFDHEPNVSAAIFLRQEVAPLLPESIAPIKIVGNNPPRIVRSMDKFGKDATKVKVIGHVPETFPVLNSSMVSLAPVPYGAGMNGKIGEALCAGLPVVTNSLGAAGMSLTHEENCIVANTPEEFVNAIRLLHENEALWEKLQRQGLQHVRELCAGHTLPKQIKDRLALPQIRAAQKQPHSFPSLQPITLPPARFKAVKKRPSHSIVLLTYNQWQHTHRCLQSLAHAQEIDPELAVEIIVVDNASTDETREALAAIPGIKLILNDSNLGFAAGNNIGIQAASGENVIILNNDTIVPPYWLRRLAETAARVPNLGVLCPSTNTEELQAIHSVKYNSLEEFFQFNELLYENNRGAWETIEKACGFCLYLPRKTIDLVGVFDTIYGIGYFEDDDYSLRMRDAGLHLICAKDVYIHHFGSASFEGANMKRQLHLQNGMTQFVFKWGRRGLDHVARMHKNTMLRFEGQKVQSC